MTQVKFIRNKFNAGELSPLLAARLDFDKFNNGCETLENFIPKVQGPITKRPGTRYVTSTKYPDRLTRLVPFQFSNTQSYILEMGDLYLRVYRNGGQIVKNNVPYEIKTPFTEDQVNDLQFSQSADVVYISHISHPPQKLSRFAHDNWTLEKIDFIWPPFESENTADKKLIASGTTGTIEISANFNFFTADMKGSYLRFSEVVASKYDSWTSDKHYGIGSRVHYQGNLYRSETGVQAGTRPPIHTEGSESDGKLTWKYQHDGEGYVHIKSVYDSFKVIVEVIKQLPESVLQGGTVRWSLSAWSTKNGYPRTLCFFEDRLWLAGSPGHPQTLWASLSGHYESIKQGSKDDDGLTYTINSQQLDAIQWIQPDKFLMIGTSGSEFVASGSRPEEAITPTNTRIVPQTTYGVSPIPPVQIGNAVLFIQRAKRKLREFVYQFESDAYTAPDLTILANHILADHNGAVAMSLQQETNHLVWVQCKNGTLASMTYERSEDVVGWHRHSLGGSGHVESLATIPHWSGEYDVLWLIVKRSIQGKTVQYVEYLENEKFNNDAFYVDSGLTYTGEPVTVLTNLDHLENETVSILIDGTVHPSQIVKDGKITLDGKGSKVQVGLPYTAKIKTMSLHAVNQMGTTQGKPTRVTDITLRLYKTGSGLFYGADSSSLDELYLRQSATMTTSQPLFTGDTECLSLTSNNVKAPYLICQHGTPLPCTLVGIFGTLVQ
ncbi:MAG: hypothetical protein KZQ59_12300 [Candidatus Thiodiazotropha sp. (ex Lucinoma aequizonata)]|nr:hypothetical protein [Candidatus Thiodiazotropha sp. (ex Lucinoma aequizonata)]MCU7895101.1 hypothetical protein [Candidatus Thiodiazotropha sp. (ex Lucinoma aequizonata)]